MTVRNIVVSGRLFQRLAEQGAVSVTVCGSYKVRRGDVVEFQNAEDESDTRPYRTVRNVYRDEMELSAEETFIEAQRRWRREEKEEKLRRRHAEISCDS